MLCFARNTLLYSTKFPTIKENYQLCDGHSCYFQTSCILWPAVILYYTVNYHHIMIMISIFIFVTNLYTSDPTYCASSLS